MKWVQADTQSSLQSYQRLSLKQAEFWAINLQFCMNFDNSSIQKAVKYFISSNFSHLSRLQQLFLTQLWYPDLGFTTVKQPNMQEQHLQKQTTPQQTHNLV